MDEELRNRRRRRQPTWKQTHNGGDGRRRSDQNQIRQDQARPGKTSNGRDMDGHKQIRAPASINFLQQTASTATERVSTAFDRWLRAQALSLIHQQMTELHMHCTALHASGWLFACKILCYTFISSLTSDLILCPDHQHLHLACPWREPTRACMRLHEFRIMLLRTNSCWSCISNQQFLPDKLRHAHQRPQRNKPNRWQLSFNVHTRRLAV